MFWPLKPLSDSAPPGIEAAVSPNHACEGSHACEGRHGWGVLDGGIFDFEAYGFEAYGGGKMRLIAESPCPIEEVLCA
jgi:hypothetical protein